MSKSNAPYSPADRLPERELELEALLRDILHYYDEMSDQYGYFMPRELSELAGRARELLKKSRLRAD